MKTILIVDDELHIQNIISELINQFTNYKTVVAEDGEAALDIAADIKPDLMLIDMMMPRVGGIALFQDLKHNKETRDIPVIFLSGQMVNNAFQKEGIEMGAVDYITKPFEKNELIEKINKVLG